MEKDTPLTPKLETMMNKRMLARISWYPNRNNCQSLMKTLGIMLLLAGFIMTIFTGFHSVNRKQVAEMGSVEINRKVRSPVQWGPAAGSILVVAGVVIVVAGRGRKNN